MCRVRCAGRFQAEARESARTADPTKNPAIRAGTALLQQVLRVKARDARRQHGVETSHCESDALPPGRLWEKPPSEARPGRVETREATRSRTKEQAKGHPGDRGARGGPPFA